MPRGRPKGSKNSKTTAKKAKPAATQAAKPSDVRKMPSANKIKELARNMNHAKESTSEINGSLGSQLRTASENNGVHTGALKDAVKNARKEAGRLAEYLDHRDFYEDVLGVRAKAESAPSLPLEGEEEGEEAGETETEQSGNVEPFPQPKAVAAE